MNKLLISCVVSAALAFNAHAATTANHALDAKESAIINIAAFCATGDVDGLKTQLTQGLEAGLSINEIKEVLVQTYAYAGFPKSLNGINAFMQVLQERKAQGIEDVIGKDSSPLPQDMDKNAYGARVRADLGKHDTIPEPSGYQVFCPVIDDFLKEHLFADIFARDVLDAKTRELTTVAMLTAQGLNAQLNSHMRFALNAGNSVSELTELCKLMSINIGKDKGQAAQTILNNIINH